jgi:uncharacterized protein (TIGR03067 family)
MRFKVDCTQTPRRFDLLVPDKDDTENIVPGIFETAGDELRVCLDIGGQGRPPTLESKSGSGYRLLILKRLSS